MIDLEAMKARVLEQTGDDFMELALDDGRVFQVPRLPFLHWALGNHGRHLLPEWKWVAPFGLKMMNDNVWHTDWMLGAGINIWSWHGRGSLGIDEDSALVRGAWDRRYELQAEMLGFECAVLSGAGRVEGYVIHPEPNQGLNLKLGPDVYVSHHKDVRVIVIPHAGPEYVQAAEEIRVRGGAVITERGGAMAHLVNIGREQNMRIVRAEDAIKRYPGHMTWVTVDCDRGTIRIRAD